MTVEEIQKICPKAENISLTGDTIGMKVGEFSMARNVMRSEEPGTVERQIKNLYLDLQAQNREYQSQINEARILRDGRST